MNVGDHPVLPGAPGPRVRFRLRDVFVPELEGVRAALDGEWEVVGTLVGLSDSGDRPGEYGIVQVARGVNLIVPVVSLTEVGDGGRTHA